MKVQLKTHARYRVVVNTKHVTPAGLGVLRTRLVASGFEAIALTPERGRVTVEATYCGAPREIDLTYDVQDLQQVA